MVKISQWLFLCILIPSFPLLFTFFRDATTTYDAHIFNNPNALCSFILSICLGVLASSSVIHVFNKRNTNQMFLLGLGFFLSANLVLYTMSEFADFYDPVAIKLNILFPSLTVIISLLSFLYDGEG